MCWPLYWLKKKVRTSLKASAYELMSVRMTRTCFSHWYARYSAVVKAIRGVMIRSMLRRMTKIGHNAYIGDSINEMVTWHFEWSLRNLRRIVCEVQKKTRILHGAVFFKVLFEKSCCFHVYLFSDKMISCRFRILRAIFQEGKHL